MRSQIKLFYLKHWSSSDKVPVTGLAVCDGMGGWIFNRTHQRRPVTGNRWN